MSMPRVRADEGKHRGFADLVLNRLCRMPGGSACARGSTPNVRCEGVRAPGFPRPPWKIAYEGLFSTSWQDEAGAMSIEAI